MISVLKKYKYEDIIAFILTIVFGIVGSIVSVVRFWQYDAYYIDFGIFDQAIWKVAHFQPPVIEHFIVGGKVIFADHFNPSIFILSPLYWITSRSEIILIAQSVAVAASGFVIYLIAKEVLKNAFWSIAILFCYFLFVGLQNAVITEFHELTVMTLSLALLWWAVVKQKKILYFLMLIITLGFKEALFPLGIGMGIAIFFLQKSWRREAIITIIVSIIWGIVAIKFIIPFFSDGIYLYALKLPSDNLEKITALFNEAEKRRTVFFSFASFGFLPLFSPAFWPAMLQDYVGRFLPEGFNTRWGLGLHYNAQSAVLFALSSIYSVRYFLKNKVFKKYSKLIAVGLIIFVWMLNMFVLHGPFHLVYNPAFYGHISDSQFLDNLVNKVPPDATVATHNNLAARFTHQQVYLLRKTYKKNNPEYIIIDVRMGQGPTNFFGTADDVEGVKAILEKVKKDKRYKIIYKTNEQFVFKRI